MKKTLISTLIITLLCTTISFANPNEHITLAVKDLTRVENDLGIIIKNIISCEYNEESIRKTLEFDSGIISSIYSRCSMNHKKGDPNIIKREVNTILYICSVYGLAINGILLYLEDKNSNEAYFLDSISEYRMGIITLEEFKKFLNKTYKVDL